ncbi:MAG: MBL fold metallo-hydrolase [Deltaproteobacteria bacterium]|nr:MBL fold metallo-hydrolase [Candidatus Zymogenaceae bacterium]
MNYGTLLETSDFGDVTQIRLARTLDENPLYTVCAYLVDGLLIDTGPAHTAGVLSDYLAEKTLRAAVNTHYHEDHVGANRLLSERFGIDIFARADAVSPIANPPAILSYQETVWGVPEGSAVLPLGDTIGTPRFSFDVVHTPGHSKGDVTLVERETGWCFSGDLISAPKPKTARREEDVPAMIASLRELSTHPAPALTLFTATGAVFENGRETLLAAAEYLERIGEEARALHREGCEPADIMHKLFGRETALKDLTEGDFSTENLIRSLLYLQK